MLGSFTLNFILLYIICGYSVAYFGVYVLKHHYLGRTWGAVIISVIGAFLGALLSSVVLYSSMSIYNVLTALLLSSLSLYVYGKASRYHHD